LAGSRNASVDNSLVETCVASTYLDSC